MLLNRPKRSNCKKESLDLDPKSMQKNGPKAKNSAGMLRHALAAGAIDCYLDPKSR